MMNKDTKTGLALLIIVAILAFLTGWYANEQTPINAPMVAIIYCVDSQCYVCPGPNCSGECMQVDIIEAGGQAHG
jgi:hypothetical protein